MKSRRRTISRKELPTFWMRMRTGIPLLAVVALGIPPLVSHAEPVTGLVVHLGCSDIPGVLQLQNQKKRSVIGICQSFDQVQQGREAASANGLSGFVQFVALQNKSRLPFPSNYAQYIVADLDALGSSLPGESEIDRILAPLGTKKVKRGGWKTTVKPMDPDMDDWPMHFKGPHMNSVSNDKKVGPPNSFGWMIERDFRSPIYAHGNVYAVNQFLGNNFMGKPKKINKYQRHKHTRTYSGRNAFSGWPIWDKEIKNAHPPGESRAGFSASARYLHYMRQDDLETHVPIVIDPKTGNIVKELPLGIPAKTKKFWQIPAGERLLQAYGKRMRVVDLKNNSTIWEYKVPSHNIGFVAASDGLDTVYYQEATSDFDEMGRRWQNKISNVVMVVKGRKVWGKSSPLNLGGHMSLADGNIFLFNGDQYDVEHGLGMAALNAKTGNVKWKYKEGVSAHNGFINWKGTNYISGEKAHLLAFSNDGTQSKIGGRGYNMACTRLSATPNWLMHGKGVWRYPNMDWTVRSVGRNECGVTASYFAYGGVHFESNGCNCVAGLKGLAMASPEISFPPEDGARRLVSVGGNFSFSPTAPPPQFKVDDNAIVRDWIREDYYRMAPHQVTSKVQHAGLEIWSDVHRHTVYASRGGNVAWKFVAGGRVYFAPNVVDGIAYVASADGYLYALDAATGKLKWKFLAAGAERYVNLNAQLESAWPLYGSASFQGLIWTVAGRQGELDNGLFVWGLDPKTGAVKKQFRLFYPPTRFGKDESMPKSLFYKIKGKVFTTARGGPLIVKEGQLVLASFTEKRSGSGSSASYTYWPEGASFFTEHPLQVDQWNGKVVHATLFTPLDGKNLPDPSPVAKREFSNLGFDFGLGWIRTDREGFAELDLMDASGRLISSLYQGEVQKGRYRVVPNQDISRLKGVYVIRMKFSGQTISKAFVLGR